MKYTMKTVDLQDKTNPDKVYDSPLLAKKINGYWVMGSSEPVFLYRDDIRVTEMSDAEKAMTVQTEPFDRWQYIDAETEV